MDVVEKDKQNMLRFSILVDGHDHENVISDKLTALKKAQKRLQMPSPGDRRMLMAYLISCTPASNTDSESSSGSLAVCLVSKSRSRALVFLMNHVGGIVSKKQLLSKLCRSWHKPILHKLMQHYAHIRALVGATEFAGSHAYTVYTS
jgi:hypothetical protein